MNYGFKFRTQRSQWINHQPFLNPSLIADTEPIPAIPDGRHLDEKRTARMCPLFKILQNPLNERLDIDGFQLANREFSVSSVTATKTLRKQLSHRHNMFYSQKL